MTIGCHDFSCGQHGTSHGEPFDAAKHCRKCYGAARHPQLAASLKRPLAFATAATVSPPVQKLGRMRACKDLGDKVDPACACEDRHCLAGLGVVKHREHCQTCERYVAKGTAAAKPAPPPVPLQVADALPPLSRTVVNLPGHFNGSLREFGGKLLLATRQQQHTLHLSELDDAFQPRWTIPLPIAHPAAGAGADDPRLYVLGGRLHVGFAAISAAGATVETVRVRQGGAVLRDDFTVESPRVFDHGGRIEKNWGWFEPDGQLHAVYSISPHRVLRIGESVEHVHEAPNRLPWSGGYLRGGSPPVRIGNEYWCWFHGADEGRMLRTYNVGVYAFEAKPPFAITRMSPAPLLWAKPSERRADGRADVVFPAGAVFRGGRWLVSMGVSDERTEIAEWDHAEVEKLCKRT